MRLNRRPHALAIVMAALLAAFPAGGYCAGSANAPDEPPALIAVGDFNGDGIADEVKVEGHGAGPHYLTVLLGKADGTFHRVPSRIGIGNDPRALVVGDFNGDGNPDVIIGDANGVLLEFLGNGRGNLVSAGKIATLGSIVSIAVGHFTHNHSLDLVVSDVDSNSAAILLNAGDGSFRQTWSFELPRRGEKFHIATADFNQDGIADLIIGGDENGDYVVMLGNGNGTFTYAPKLSHLKDPNSYCPT
jgi:FG-GAP-like repeat